VGASALTDTTKEDQVTPIEAFELALDLAITAPSEEKGEQATKLAEEIAMLLTNEEIKMIKLKFEMEN
jgi:hypothetical protein